MSPRQSLDLLLLAALWGGSFLFMRVAAPAFGPVTLAGVRVTGACLVLVPLLALRGQWPALRRHWKPVLFVGVTNSALPFLCFAFAALHIGAGLSSVFNAATPLFGAAIAWAWLRDRPDASRIAGLAIGFAGVLGLAWTKTGLRFDAGGDGTAWAVLACLLATLSYGFSASFSRRYLDGVPPMASAAGSQLGAALLLAGPTLWSWPAAMPGVVAWINLALLSVLCTGVAYVLFFRLIAGIGPARAITVTYLIPGFAIAWGALFLHEPVTPAMLVGCAVILAGTALGTGVLQRAWASARGRPSA